jgi:hypothetical protein
MSGKRHPATSRVMAVKTPEDKITAVEQRPRVDLDQTGSSGRSAAYL